MNQAHHSVILRRTLPAVALALYSLMPLEATAKAVDVSQAALDQIASGCAAGGAACTAAFTAVVAELQTANPGSELELLLISLVAAVTDAYNSGAIPATIASAALSAAQAVASSAGQAATVASISVALASVEAGNPVPFSAVAQGAAASAVVGTQAGTNGGNSDNGGSGINDQVASGN